MISISRGPTYRFNTNVVRIMKKLCNVSIYTKPSHFSYTYAKAKPNPITTPYPTACDSGGFAMVICLGVQIAPAQVLISPRQ
jgi:hypothetical protein